MNEIEGYPSILIEYFTYLNVIKEKSTLTVSEYALDLRTFFRFLKQKKGGADSPSDSFESIDITDIDLDFISKITLFDAYEFLKYCKEERNNSATSRSRKISAIRSFYNYLTIKTHQLEENPMLELDAPKIKSTLPKYLTLDQSKELLNSISGKHSERNFAIIVLFLNCGLRLSELVGLNMGDIRDDGTIRVTGKGNKERIIYINEACKKAVDNYLKIRPRDGLKDRNALFISQQKKRISPKTVQYLVKNYLEKSGLGDQGYSTHKLRHTAATLMYQHGNVDMLSLKEILGHENLGTTEIYTHISDEKLKKAADANPLSKVDKANLKD